MLNSEWILVKYLKRALKECFYMGLMNTLKLAATKKECTLKEAVDGAVPNEPGVYVVYHQGKLKCVSCGNSLLSTFENMYNEGTRDINETNRDEIKLIWSEWDNNQAQHVQMAWEMENNFRSRGDKLPWQKGLSDLNKF